MNTLVISPATSLYITGWTPVGGLTGAVVSSLLIVISAYSALLLALVGIVAPSVSLNWSDIDVILSSSVVSCVVVDVREGRGCPSNSTWK